MRILVHTIPPYDGGVPAKARILCRHLDSRGHSVTVAHYATHGHEPELVAPSWRLHSGARPRSREGNALGFPSIAIGCFLPELEWTYYLPSRSWSRLMAEYDRHVVVCGNVLAAYRIARAKLPHLVWCASPLIDDRLARQRQMPLLRRMVDCAMTVPVLRYLENRVLQGPGHFMGVSSYTVEGLARLGARSERLSVLPVPVDCNRFRPPPEPAPNGIVGFAGRLTDPRKNVDLLLKAVALANARGGDLRLRLTGDPLPSICEAANRQGIDVQFSGHLPPESLPDFYAGLDVFAIPSQQEGLGIVGVEALATGVPIVSTRCGGPEDYVIPARTGFLVENAEQMADRLREIVTDRALRNSLSRNARELAQSRYGMQAFGDSLAQAWRSVWEETP